MVEYGEWTKGKKAVFRDGKEIGFITEDMEGYAYWEKLSIGAQLVKIGRTIKSVTP